MEVTGNPKKNFSSETTVKAACFKFNQSHGVFSAGTIVDPINGRLLGTIVDSIDGRRQKTGNSHTRIIHAWQLTLDVLGCASTASWLGVLAVLAPRLLMKEVTGNQRK